MRRSFWVAAACALMLAASLHAQIPRTISFQGVLTDAAGVPVTDGQQTLTFNLYAAATGGTSAWSETQTVATRHGVFSVLLGASTPLRLLFDRPLWLGITVAGAELSPRTPLASVPTSLRTQSADSARVADMARNAELLSGFAASATPQPGGILVLDAAGRVPVSAIPSVPVQIADGSITTPKLADGSVTAVKLAPGAIAASAIALPFILTNTAGWSGGEYVIFGDNRGGGGGVRGSAMSKPGIAGASSSASGVYGTSTGAEGVRGESASAGGGTGVTGINTGSGKEGFLGTPMAGVQGNGYAGFGVWGISTTNVGVRGESTSGDGVSARGAIGVRAEGTGEYGVWAMGGTGVYGESSANYGQGVHGRGTGARTEGVLGTSEHAPGVYGITGGAASQSAGVLGDGTDAYGVWGRSSKHDGVCGETTSALRSGVFGKCTDPGGNGVTGGNSARNTSGYLGGEYGARGIRDDYEGFLGFSDGGVLGRHNASGNYGYLGMSGRAIFLSGAFYQTGGVFEAHPTSTVWTTNKPATVKLRDGTRVKLFAEESAEVLFSDYGGGRLENGRAHIALDAVFAQTVTVDDAHPMRVFVQLEDECLGVYVTGKSATGFDVIELQGGRSDARFSYRVVCTRRHYEGERLATEEVDAQFNARMLDAVWPEVRAEQSAMDRRVRAMEPSTQSANSQRK